MKSEIELSDLGTQTLKYIWIFLSMVVLVVICKIFLSNLDRLYIILNSKYITEVEHDLYNFENEEEKKLFYLTRVFTRINKNISYDLQSLADKGI